MMSIIIQLAKKKKNQETFVKHEYKNILTIERIV